MPTFSTDAFLVAHAETYATRTFGEGTERAFVSFLSNLPLWEQERVQVEGYRVVADVFREAYRATTPTRSLELSRA